MAEPVAPAFKEALQRHAQKYNALFAAAQESRPLDGDRFGAHLREVVAPIVEALAILPGTEESSIDALTEVLYGHSLGLMRRGLLACETPSPDFFALYTEILPRLAPFLRSEPALLINSLTKALPLLARQDEELPQRWLKSLISHSKVCESARELLDLGKVLAWTHGMAHFRESALQVYAALPKKVQGALPPQEDLYQPWPKFQEVTFLGPAGAFRGFGGHFAAPPVLEMIDEKLFVFDGLNYFWLHADRFGATAMRIHEKDLPTGPKQEPLELYPYLLERLPQEFAEDRSSQALAFQNEVLALTLPFSFKVYLFYLPEEMRP